MLTKQQKQEIKKIMDEVAQLNKKCDKKVNAIKEQIKKLELKINLSVIERNKDIDSVTKDCYHCLNSRQGTYDKYIVKDKKSGKFKIETMYNSKEKKCGKYVPIDMLEYVSVKRNTTEDTFIDAGYGDDDEYRCLAVETFYAICPFCNRLDRVGEIVLERGKPRNRYDWENYYRKTGQYLDVTDYDEEIEFVTRDEVENRLERELTNESF